MATPQPIFSRARAAARSWRRRAERAYQDRKGRMTLDIRQLLLGDECGLPAANVAKVFGNPLRPSTTMADSPHVQLLREFDRIGDALFDSEALVATPYYQNAFLNVDIFGHYFSAKTVEQIPAVIRRFVDQYRGASAPSTQQQGQSPPGAPIRVRPVGHSSFFQLIDGHHRVALALARGEQTVEAISTPDSVLTPMQEKLLEVLWLGGRRELYQPVDLPEIKEQWTLVRKCSDRLEKMLALLENGNPAAETGNSLSYLDLGSSYGWFVAEMESYGLDAWGVERDPIAKSIGEIVYGLNPDKVKRSDIVRFLRSEQRQYDVVSCFSVLHHFHINNCGTPPEEVLRLIDKITARVLFFDMGHCGEAWFQERLKGWTHDKIHEWLQANTTFGKVQRLGIDEDAVSPFEQNYSRMLFACVR